ncbi:hypothetical protein EG347_05140 [Chryseobacterium sp. G0186]|uniref:hypothetical protein n=1 Tax=Chryseobacterium sp. G0186 TaxID=2487064 RepID=UPI000F4E0F5B|nr:hypothetical protein [Chryseobacterium sp. G0186]AZA76933.1 hypothetical protein EG347_05140 [Chryseobacterium sp. G0186]
MFSFHYTFERAIQGEKTVKDVTDVACNSFREREVNDIHIQDNTIMGKDSLIKLDFSRKSPLILSPGKEYFIYNEGTKILTYKVEAFYPILFNLIYAGILFLILYFFARHWIIELVIPGLFFIIITIVDYFQHQAVIDKISRILNIN